MKRVIQKIRRGFTISEILIVIVTIAIIAGIVFVSWMGIRERSEFTRARSELAQIGKSADTYTVFNDQQRPMTDEAFASIFKEAGLYASTRSAAGDSFAICATADGYVIVAWNPIVTGYKNGDMLYTYSATEGQDIVELTNSSLSALPQQIDKVCNAVYPVPNSVPQYQRWTYDLP